MKNTWPRLLYFLFAILYRLFRLGKPLCPHCRCLDTSLVGKKHMVIHVRQCKKCALYFINPIYGSAFAQVLYSTSFYCEKDRATRIPERTELDVLLNNGFADSSLDNRKRLQIIRNTFGGHSLLEFGCSWGYFLCQAQKAEYCVAGIEISTSRSAFGRNCLGLDIRSSFRDFLGQRFDVIYTSHVLEHLLDLSTIFIDLRNSLADEGTLIIEVPRFDYEVEGRRALTTIGAVHPLGFGRRFFEQNLPVYGFSKIRFYNNYEEVPATIANEPASVRGSLIVTCGCAI